VSAETPFPMTVFWLDRLARTPQTGIHVPETWPGFVRWVSHPVVTAAKEAEGGFTLATLRDGIRRKSHVVSVTALAVDHDEGTATAAKAHASLTSFAHVVFTTHSHTTDRPRWRAVVPFDRPATAEEYPALYALAALQFARDGIVLDATTKDPCRLWYTPTVKPGAPFEVYVGDGEPVSVDKMLAIAAELERQKPARRPPAPVAADHRDAYVRGAIRRAQAAVSGASEGERHLTLSREAFALGRQELGLSDGAIEDALLPAFVHAAGESRRHEGVRTIRDGIRARRAA
jgi:hypothetical protein